MQAGFDGGPFAGDDAVIDGVAVDAVPGDAVVAECAFALGADALNGALGALVAAVGFEADAQGGQVVKGVAQHQVLAFGVDGGALVGHAVPGHTDFQGAVGAVDVQVAGGADGPAVGEVDDGELDAGFLLVAGQAGVHPGLGVLEVGEGGAGQVAPDGRVGAGGVEVGGVLGADGFQADVAAGEGYGLGVHSVVVLKGNVRQ